MDRKQIERDIEVLSRTQELGDKHGVFIIGVRTIKRDLELRLQATERTQTEVSIWDVIEECKGVTDPNRLAEIVSKYEVYFSEKWIDLSKRVWYLDQPIEFINSSRQLRLKEATNDN